MNFFERSIFSNSFVIYTFLFSMIFVQLYFFPDVLNNKDIKINDLSYLLPPRVKVETLPTTPITIVPAEKKQPETTNEKDTPKPKEQQKVPVTTVPITVISFLIFSN